MSASITPSLLCKGEGYHTFFGLDRTGTGVSRARPLLDGHNSPVREEVVVTEIGDLLMGGLRLIVLGVVLPFSVMGSSICSGFL